MFAPADVLTQDMWAFASVLQCSPDAVTAVVFLDEISAI